MKLAPTASRWVAFSLALLTGGCNVLPFGHNAALSAPPALAANAPPSVACPWLDSEHYRPAVKLPDATGAALVSPAHFVPGCAIIRFNVAADGSAANPALRAAMPLNAGPVALAALAQMRFQPARNPDAEFVIRLGMDRDSSGRIIVTPDTRRRVMGFWDLS